MCPAFSFHPWVTDNCRHSGRLWRHPGPSICLIGEELTIPVHWEGMPRLTEALADASGPLCLLSWAVPMPVQPSLWSAGPEESPFLPQPPSELKTGSLRKSQGYWD